MKPNNDAAREKETETLVAIQNILAQYDDVLSPHLGLTLARYCEAFAAEQTAELRAEVDRLRAMVEAVTQLEFSAELLGREGDSVIGIYRELFGNFVISIDGQQSGNYESALEAFEALRSEGK